MPLEGRSRSCRPIRRPRRSIRRRSSERDRNKGGIVAVCELGVRDGHRRFHVAVVVGEVATFAQLDAERGEEAGRDAFKFRLRPVTVGLVLLVTDGQREGLLEADQREGDVPELRLLLGDEELGLEEVALHEGHLGHHRSQ